jgi:DNA helicase-2/ATP-dependent DNA helicase PcrA
MAGFRVALLVPGMGPAAARRLVAAIEADADPADALRRFAAPRNAAAAWRALHDCLVDMQRAAAHWPQPLERALGWYLPHLQRLHDPAGPREADLHQLLQIARGYSSRDAFLADLTLHPPEATSDDAGEPHRDDDYLILSTIHSAKGQEWAAVYVLNVVDGCIPSDLGTGSVAEIDEERRLLYVAMTRAQQHLQLLVPQRFHVTQQPARGDRHLYGHVSRFVSAEVAACCDALNAAEPADDGWTPPQPADQAVRIDIGSALRSIWD